MAKPPVRQEFSGTGPDWARLCAHARAALAERLTVAGELTPCEAARSVTGTLPQGLGRWLLERLEQRGWLAPDVVLPFDVLEGASCPPEFRGGPREVVRLAVFGLSGQGLSYRDKHRQDIYQQLCAQIMSGAVDQVSLQSIAARVLHNPDVSGDGTLASMLRSFIAQREASLRAGPTPAEAHALSEERSKLQSAFGGAGGSPFPTREALIVSFGRLQRDFDAFLAQFDEKQARLVLDKMRELRRRFPVHIAAVDLQRCEEQLDRLLKQAGQYRRQINELAEKGAAAARTGEQKTAVWITRRLQAINTLMPSLLPPEELERLQSEISRGGDVHETQEAARELLERQREVADKIRELAGVIHRFHELAQRLPPEDNAYRRAEVNYRRAVEEIRHLDTSWLTSLVLQLESLLDDLDDPTGQMHTQLDRFIASVRTALNRLCLEIRARQRAKGAAPLRPAPPPGEAGAPPP